MAAPKHQSSHGNLKVFSSSTDKMPAASNAGSKQKRGLKRKDMGNTFDTRDRRQGYTHNGRKHFKCSFCPYSASQKGNLKTHVLCVHRMPFDNSLYPDRRFKRSRPEFDIPEKSPDDAAGRVLPNRPMTDESNVLWFAGEAESRHRE